MAGSGQRLVSKRQLQRKDFAQNRCRDFAQDPDTVLYEILAVML
jgi:hypothetical protein